LTGDWLKFRISAYSSTLFTAMITTVRIAVAVGGALVAVGTGDAVGMGVDVLKAVAVACVGDGVPVREGVKLGNDVGTKNVRVGNGVRVGKLNREVGVASVPRVGKTSGLGGTSEGARERSKGIGARQRQQNKTPSSPGMST
jgi:hypothetical protein